MKYNKAERDGSEKRGKDKVAEWVQDLTQQASVCCTPAGLFLLLSQQRWILKRRL